MTSLEIGKISMARLPRHLALSLSLALATVFVLATPPTIARPFSSSRPFATALGECEPPDPAMTDDFKRWAGVVDYLHDKARRAKERDGDVVLPFGPVVAENCLAGPWKTKAKAVLDLLTKTLSRALEQSYRCDKALGIWMAADVVTVLRRARISCEDLPFPLKMMNRYSRYQPMIAPLNATKTSFNHSYLIEIDRRYIEETLTSPPEQSKRNLESFSASFFHEALHSTANNSANDTHANVGGESGKFCKRSVFKDRIYFLESVCFPGSLIGSYLENTLPSCPEVCETAFTRTIPSAAKLKGQGSLFIPGVEGAIGADLNAQPLKKREARALCRRIRASKTKAKELKAELSDQSSRRLPFLDNGRQGETRKLLAANEALRKEIEAATAVIDSIRKQPYRWSEAARQMRRHETQSAWLIEQTCRDKDDHASETTLSKTECREQGHLILAEIRSVIDKLDVWAAREKVPLEGGFGLAQDLLKFYFPKDVD